MNLKFLPGMDVPLDTPLWRYMKLSTFFLLLKGKTFIPVLRKLQEGDPQEGQILRGSPWDEDLLGLDQFIKAWDWLKKTHRTRRFDLDKLPLHGHQHGVLLLDEWRYQLSTRRCVWCWFAPTTQSESFHVESMAMWNLYARDGVAIKTSLGNIKLAIQEPELDEMLVAKMDYDGLLTETDFLKRPFLFKSGSYAHEKEVRLVFRVNANSVISGLKLNVDPNALLKGGEVVMSPYMARADALAIENVARDLLKGSDVQFRQSSEHAAKSDLPKDCCDEVSDLRQSRRLEIA